MRFNGLIFSSFIFQREMRSVGDSVAGNYSSEAATLMVQKVFRISNNLEERKRLLSGRVEYT